MPIDPHFISNCLARLNRIFDQHLQNIPSLPLKNAMQYTLSNGGKRLRPLLIYATGEIFDAPLENCDIAAAAVEIIHTYSLVHDDLPSMDNADLRRGKPTIHKKFGEGLAILAGDALHTLAMEILANRPAPLKADKRLQMLSVLTHACGPFGMAGGQTMDITLLCGDPLPLDLLTTIYALKTGALLTACLQLGHLASNDTDTENHKALRTFGEKIGLAFQIQDDILDIETQSAQSGKDSGLDRKNNKNTYPHLTGIDAAKNRVEQLYQEALEQINYLGHRADTLRALTEQMLTRQS